MKNEQNGVKFSEKSSLYLPQKISEKRLELSDYTGRPPQVLNVLFLFKQILQCVYLVYNV